MINWSKTKNKFGYSNLKGYRPKVIVECDSCGKESVYTVRIKSKIDNNQINWNCQKCISKSKNIRNKLKESTTKLWQNKEYRDKIIKNSRDRWLDENYKNKLSSNTNEFILKSNIVHNYIYDYSKVRYHNSKINVVIVCPVHGEFEQLPLNHLMGHGCPLCNRITKEEFISRSNIIHDYKYSYDNIDYINSSVKIYIECPIHGMFMKTPISHLNGHGCPKCAIKIPKAQNEIRSILNNLNVKLNDRAIIPPYEIDIFVPDYHIGIEHHGLYYHSYNRLETRDEKYKHYHKADICKRHNILLLQIFEDEWQYKNNIVKSIIKSKFNTNDRVFARKCIVSEINSKDFNLFCENNHIQGKLDTKIRLGLYHNNNLVCVMGFNKHKKYSYECTRFCNLLNVNTVGGASKLFNYFIKNYNPKSILSYADRRFSNGSLYYKLGFVLESITKPGYFYVKGNNRYTRHKFQKFKLKNKLIIYDDKLTEADNMFNNGYRRIWDAGHYKFIWYSSR